VTTAGDETRCRAFLDGMSLELRDAFAARADLSRALTEAVQRARAAWPEIELSDEVFLRHLGTHVKEARALETLKIADLYAACACAANDPRAIAAVEARCFPPIAAALARMRLDRRREEDVLQGLRRHVFVRDAGPPRIFEYSGQGDLRAWLQVIATRAALKVIRHEKREVRLPDQDLIEAGTAGDDIELAYVKRAYREQFHAAFGAALEALDARDKTLLRLQIVDELGIDQIGALYQVHRATAARWLSRARETLLDETRARFMSRVRISRTECNSIMRALLSQLDLTIRRRLV
jgi:RNA polymerase sigma-70 factor (ECF subfamily)